MFISYCVCLKCRGRVVANVVRTCDPTPLLYIFGNKICLNKNTEVNDRVIRKHQYLGLCCVRKVIYINVEENGATDRALLNPR